MAREKVNFNRKQSVLALSISTMWSKVFGFLREMLTAYYFGAQIVKDTFNVSQAIPGRIRGAFSAAINNSLIPYLIHPKTDEGMKLSGRHTQTSTSGLKQH